jgi:hypothetical protein
MSDVTTMLNAINQGDTQAAHELDISIATAERVWGFARAWLLREIRKQPSGKGPPPRMARPTFGTPAAA